MDGTWRCCRLTALVHGSDIKQRTASLECHCGNSLRSVLPYDKHAAYIGINTFHLFTLGKEWNFNRDFVYVGIGFV